MWTDQWNWSYPYPEGEILLRKSFQIQTSIYICNVLEYLPGDSSRVCFFSVMALSARYSSNFNASKVITKSSEVSGGGELGGRGEEVKDMKLFRRLIVQIVWKENNNGDQV